MRFVSTRGNSPALTLSESIAQGLAPDGGLYVPEIFPNVSPGKDAVLSLQHVAQILLSPFFVGDALEDQLHEIIEEAFDFPIPLVDMKGESALLELFHGPSAAFKDVGARFLASVVSRLERGHEKPLTILVATSGDTGGAVAAAFHNKPGVRVVVLYPDGKVSKRQAHQLSCWGDNIQTFAVKGVFDDCQRIVKEAFQDEWFQKTFRLSSANSINVGRLLPQACYHAWASLEYYRRTGRAPGLVIPSGNLGNALAAIWAREMGFPIREVLLAVNANEPLLAWYKTGDYIPKPAIATLANAMDVGAPSNMERLLSKFSYSELQHFLRVDGVSDSEIEDLIRRGEKDWGHVFCPHTACGIVALERVSTEDWVVCATAHPAKFETIVEPLIHKEVSVPPALDELLKRPAHATQIEPQLDALKKAMS